MKTQRIEYLIGMMKAIIISKTKFTCSAIHFILHSNNRQQKTAAIHTSTCLKTLTAQKDALFMF